MEDLQNKITDRESDICDLIMSYGKDILSSDLFRQAASEKHHIKGTLLDHTINVCVVSLRLSRQLKSRGVDVNEKALVRAALCHDLGMVGRNDKYKDRLESWKKHPEESAHIARMLLPDLTAQEEDMILTHMWPVAGQAPGSSEGRLLCIADKYASMEDWKSWLKKERYASRIKEYLENSGNLD